MTREIPLQHNHKAFTYKLYPPHPSLLPFVRCYWVLKSGVQSLKQELMIPDGYIDLIFNYGQAYRRAEIEAELNWLKITTSHIVGPRVASVLVENNTNLDVVGVKLKPYGLWTLTQIPTRDFFSQVIPVDLIQPSLSELEHQIYDAPGDVEKIQVIEKFLKKRFLLYTEESEHSRKAYSGAVANPNFPVRLTLVVCLQLVFSVRAGRHSAECL